MARKVAFITGASRGIGRAAALALAGVGYDIVATARSVRGSQAREYSSSVKRKLEVALPGTLEETAALVRERGRESLVFPLDLLDPKTIDAALEGALAQWGQIDLLLNNGIYQGPGLMDLFLDVPLDIVETVFRGNVFSQIYLTQQVLPAMLARGAGIVINMTSGSALQDPPAPAGQGGWGYVYAASKAAFHRMVPLLHVEHASRGLRCYNVEPGYVPNQAQRASIGGGGKNALDDHFRGAPVEVPAAGIAWLASAPEAAALAGQTVFVQKLVKERGLVPGWPPPRAPKT
jgi:NAD(P)-dependent dehydrogenase (short-subunit alcohol dehydrogenase family)